MQKIREFFKMFLDNSHLYLYQKTVLTVQTMASLKEIKNRIGSVKSTQKITKAMKMISTARLNKARVNLQTHIEYSNALISFVASLLPFVEKDTETNSSIVKNFICGNSSNVLTLVISTDKGLCGALNTFIFKELHKDSNNTIFPIGKKAFEYTKSRFNIPIQRAILTSKPENHHEIVEEVLSFIKKNDIGKLKIIFPEFISVMTQIPKTKIFPSFELEKSYYEVEGSPIKTLEYALPEAISAIIHLSLAHLLCSEHSSRMIAMENATNNAKTRIKSLTLAYNKARQAKITGEILEIVSGSQSCKTV